MRLFYAMLSVPGVNIQTVQVSESFRSAYFFGFVGSIGFFHWKKHRKAPKALSVFEGFFSNFFSPQVEVIFGHFWNWGKNLKDTDAKAYFWLRNWMESFYTFRGHPSWSNIMTSWTPMMQHDFLEWCTSRWCNTLATGRWIRIESHAQRIPRAVLLGMGKSCGKIITWLTA